jgi:hypothetical protein
MTTLQQKGFFAWGVILGVCPTAAWAVTSEQVNLAGQLGRILGMALFGYLVLRWVNRKKSDLKCSSRSAQIWRMVRTLATFKKPSAPNGDQAKVSLLSRILRVFLWGVLALMLWVLANAIYMRYLLSVA